VGIYIGGNQFVHAPETGDVVKISTLTGWFAANYVGARRI
jgi:cell wall-associated NlpC family hydrolase